MLLLAPSLLWIFLFSSKRFTGKGIVMSTGKLKYFISTYLNLRVLRETVKCRLPIEIFYVGSNEMSAMAVEYLEKTFENVRVIDLKTISDFPKGMHELTGYDHRYFFTCSDVCSSFSFKEKLSSPCGSWYIHFNIYFINSTKIVHSGYDLQLLLYRLSMD
jgi:hypothetical protein